MDRPAIELCDNIWKAPPAIILTIKASITTRAKTPKNDIGLNGLRIIFMCPQIKRYDLRNTYLYKLRLNQKLKF
jgi:hypothetical protein